MPFQSYNMLSKEGNALGICDLSMPKLRRLCCDGISLVQTHVVGDESCGEDARLQSMVEMLDYFVLEDTQCVSDYFAKWVFFIHSGRAFFFALDAASKRSRADTLHLQSDGDGGDEDDEVLDEGDGGGDDGADFDDEEALLVAAARHRRDKSVVAASPHLRHRRLDTIEVCCDRFCGNYM